MKSPVLLLSQHESVSKQLSSHTHQVEALFLKVGPECWTWWVAAFFAAGRNGNPARPFPSLHEASLLKHQTTHAVAGQGVNLHTGSKKDQKMQFLRTYKSHPCFSALPLIQDNSTRSSNMAKDKRTPCMAIIRYYGSHMPILLTNTGFLLICSTIGLCTNKNICGQ